MWIMERIRKAYNLRTLVLIIILTFLCSCSNAAYSLRVPIDEEKPRLYHLQRQSEFYYVRKEGQKGHVLTFKEIEDNLGEIARIGSESLSGIRTVRPLKGKKILILGPANSYQNITISELKANNIVGTMGLHEIIEQETIFKKLDDFNPDSVILPAEGARIQFMSVVDQWATKNKKRILGLSYSTVESYRKYNLFLYYGQKELEIKDSSILAHYSQVKKVNYQLADEYSDQASAIAGKILHGVSANIPDRKYAEVFKLVRMVNGE